MKILHAPVDVGGQAWGLSRAERLLGYKSDHIIFSSSKFLYHADKNLRLERFPKLIKVLFQLFYFVRFLLVYDVFHFYFGTSLLPYNRDLPILKLFNKKIFFTFQGSDIRISKVSNTLHSAQTIVSQHNKCNNISDEIKKQKINFITKYANKTYILNPDLKLFSPASEILPYAHLFPNKWVTRNKYHTNKTHWTILHAPTDRNIKGTKYVIKSVEELQRRGYKVRLLLIENISHDEMLHACAKSDIVIDQLRIGWYGGFAVEMMSLGKPVLCYIDTRMSRYVPYFNQIPIINVTPSTLTNTIIDLIKDPYRQYIVGNKSRVFVKKIHNPLHIARKTLNHYLSC